MIIDKVVRFEVAGNPNAKFQNIEEYTKLAKRQISYFARNWGRVCGDLLKSEDAVSYVAYANMLADWRYDESKGVSPRTFRDSYAAGFVKTLISKSYRGKTLVSVNNEISPSKDNNMISLDETISNKEQFNLLDVFSDSQQKSNQRWSEEDIQCCVEKLPEREKKIIRMYIYENKNFAEIGRSLSISRERVRQIVKAALNNMKKELQNVE